MPRLAKVLLAAVELRLGAYPEFSVAHLSSQSFEVYGHGEWRGQVAQFIVQNRAPGHSPLLQLHIPLLHVMSRALSDKAVAFAQYVQTVVSKDITDLEILYSFASARISQRLAEDLVIEVACRLPPNRHVTVSNILGEKLSDTSLSQEIRDTLVEVIHEIR